jgi:hydrogenase maturation protease
MSYWEELERPGPEAVAVRGVELRRGARVRLRPRKRGDVFDVVLDGKAAVVDALEEDTDGNVLVAVTVDDDPGRDLGERRQPGHRFFFTPDEVEPLDDGAMAATARFLVAGVGNVFLGDDGFGVALADRLAQAALPAGIEVVDFGIRGMDLAYAMQDGYDAVVLLDATPRGQPPGTLYVIEAEVDGDGNELEFEAHGLDPAKVLGLVRALGGHPPRTFVVGCEPRTRMSVDDEELVAELSEPVRLALPEAERLVRSLLADLTNEGGTQ